MGYADITTTMNIYAEATKEKKQQAMANLNGKILKVMFHICTSGMTINSSLGSSVKSPPGLSL